MDELEHTGAKTILKGKGKAGAARPPVEQVPLARPDKTQSPFTMVRPRRPTLTKSFLSANPGSLYGRYAQDYIHGTLSSRQFGPKRVHSPWSSTA